MKKTVQDAAILLENITGYDSKDPTASRETVFSFTEQYLKNAVYTEMITLLSESSTILFIMIA